MKLATALGVLATAFCIAGGSKCLLKEFGPDNYVCVCNEEYCDELDPLPEEIPKGSVRVYESSQSGKRMDVEILNFQHGLNASNDGTELHVNTTDHYQEILGFGGAFTDASGINMRLLSRKMQDDIMEAYYGRSGLEYTIGRVPMASCDFSTYPYSYSDFPGDFELKNFSLTREDLQMKIPYVHAATKLTQDRGQKLLMFASPWSSPAWMKTNNKMNGDGVLRGEVGGQYYQTWANYFVRFLQEYEKQNITFWGLTAENEPSNGYKKDFPFQNLGFTAETQRDFIKMNLGPALQNAGYGVDKVHLMIVDDNRNFLPDWPVTVLSDPEAAKYVTGIAFHWYGNDLAHIEVLDETHRKVPGYFMLASEACEGWVTDRGVRLGLWDRAETYALDIMDDLLHWSVGWVDWNLALDLEGGPNWVGNFVDAPIIINNQTKEFYKQPMYYALGHFSKFIPPGSKRIGLRKASEQTTDTLETAAFLTPSSNVVLVILNRNKESVNLSVSDKVSGTFVNSVPARSIQTYVWHV